MLLKDLIEKKTEPALIFVLFILVIIYFSAGVVVFNGYASTRGNDGTPAETTASR
jgi:hypothetical protein